MGDGIVNDYNCLLSVYMEFLSSLQLICLSWLYVNSLKLKHVIIINKQESEDWLAHVILRLTRQHFKIVIFALRYFPHKDLRSWNWPDMLCGHEVSMGKLTTWQLLLCISVSIPTGRPVCDRSRAQIALMTDSLTRLLERVHSFLLGSQNALLIPEGVARPSLVPAR